MTSWKRFLLRPCVASSILLGSLGHLTNVVSPGAASDPSELPLLQIDDFLYQGAFRFPAAEFGASSLNFSEGPLEYDADDHTVYIVGHSHHQAIAEFAVPDLVLSTTLDDLEMAGPPLQVFSEVLDRVSGGNPQDLNRIGGLLLAAGPNGPELIINAYEYYDAPGDNTETTALLRDPADLAGSIVNGFFTFDGGAGHTSGWMSPIPPEWQSILGGTHITGQSSGIPIISRTSVGPSAFAFDALDLVGGDPVPEPIPTVTLLDFDLAHPLHEDLSNESGENDLWTHLSRATYGFIAPGTRTYVTLGFSGGHVSGVCYKCIQEDGYECGGYCAPDPDDYYQYYWFWDVNDLVEVKNGTMNPYDVRPYEYGEFATPFESYAKQIGGGAFDPGSGLLYLTIQRADNEQGYYDNPPVVVAYRLSPLSASADPADPSIPAFRMSLPRPNPFSKGSRISLAVDRSQHVTISIHNILGRDIATLYRGVIEANDEKWFSFDRAELPAGVYLIRVQGETFHTTRRILLAK